MHRIVLLIALSWIGMAFVAQPVTDASIHPTPGATTSPESIALRQMIAGSFEFPHDKLGEVVDTSGKLVANGAVGCERQEFWSDFRPCRELVSDALEAYALNDHGAVRLSRVVSYGHAVHAAAAAAH